MTACLFVFIRSRKRRQTPSCKTQTSVAFLLRGLLRALSKPQMWIVGIIGALLYLTLTGFSELWGIPYFKSVYHFSGMQAASLNTAMFLGWAAGGPLMGYISDKLSRLRRQLCHIIHITLNLVYDVHKNHKRTKSKSWNF